MRIGIVVDSACDLPLDYLQQHNIVILPITVRIGEAVLADHRDEQATLSFLHAHVAERGHEAETTPFTVNQIRDLFLGQLVIDYDHVFCMTITKTRSPIHDNAMQASFAILNDYKPVRQAAGHNSPFALRVIDTQNLFAAQGITAVEAVREGAFDYISKPFNVNEVVATARRALKGRESEEPAAALVREYSEASGLVGHSPKMIELSICATTVSGFTCWPQSAAQ